MLITQRRPPSPPSPRVRKLRSVLVPQSLLTLGTLATTLSCLLRVSSQVPSLTATVSIITQLLSPMFSKEDYSRISAEDGEAREDQPLNSELDVATRRSRRWVTQVSPWVVIILLGLFNSVLLVALYKTVGRPRIGSDTGHCQVLYCLSQS